MRTSLATAGVPFAMLLQSATGSAAAGEVGGVPSEPRLGRGEQSNAGRRELVFLDGELGAGYVDVFALKSGELLDTARLKSSGLGIMYGAAFGVRLQEFTLAVRYRYRDFSDWQLWTLGGEANVKFSLGRIEPSFGFGAGYASLDGVSVDGSRLGVPDPAATADIHGLNVRVNVGVAYYVLTWFSVGGNLSGEAFFLRRHGDRFPRTSPTDPNSAPMFFYALDCSGNGLGATLSVALSAHY
jgi:hypothetical protein